MKDPTPTVLEMERLHFSGNIVPHTWYQHLTREKKHRAKNGEIETYTYPYLEAIAILSDICYWYRPRVVRDEDTGHVIRYERRFSADKLQRSYAQYGDLLGLSKEQARKAIKWLEEKGVITLELRTVSTQMGNLPNVLYIEPVVSKIAEISYPVGQSQSTDISLSINQDTPPQSTDTNTETTPETTSETSEEKEKKDVFPEFENQDADIDPDTLFPVGEKKDHQEKQQAIEPFKVTGDMAADILQGARLKQRRNVPDWAIRGAEGPDPYYKVLLAFCKMTAQSAEAMGEKIGRDWLGQFTQLAEDNGLSPSHLVRAHDILPRKEWGEWFLEHHQWTDPHKTSYLGRLRMAASQIRDGVLELAPFENWSHSL